MIELAKVNAAVEALRAAGCHRMGGLWFTRDDVSLAADPVTALAALRKWRVKRVVDDHRERGVPMTR